MGVLRMQTLHIILRGPSIAGYVVSRRARSALSDRHVDPVSSGAGQNVGSLRELWSSKFSERGLPDAAASAELLVAHALNRKTLTGIPSWQILTAEHTNRINELCTKRMTRVPVQYILEEWDFRDLTLQMEPPVIIPRPETEGLIDHIKAYYAKSDKRLTFLEVGSGCGAISLSLLREIPQAAGVAIDRCDKAVALTRKNANNYSVTTELCAERLEFSTNAVGEHALLKQDYDFIVSNPPYVMSSEMPTLEQEITLHEDPCGLDGGHDGLDLVRELLQSARCLLKPKGTLWLETHCEHPPLIEQLVKTSPEWQLQFSCTFEDLFHRPRFVLLIRA